VKLLLIRGCDLDGRADGPSLVAVDAVGAGVDEVVLYASGSSARLTALTQNRPVDAVVMAVVDEVETGGARRYVKGA
jgi:microcompartment protein CcmK/EutM